MTPPLPLVILRFLLVLSAIGLPSLGTTGEDPCRPREQKRSHWRTVTGCTTLPLDPARPEAGTVAVYHELSIPMGSSLGSMIVFHGGPGYPSYRLQEQGPLWRGLRSHFHILYYHQRGSGWSEPLAGPAPLRGREGLYSLDRLVEDAAALAEVFLPKGRHVLFGKSAGGFLALKFALRYPDRVSHLVLACTTAQHGYLSERATIKEQFLGGLDQRYRGFRDRWEDTVFRMQTRDTLTTDPQPLPDPPETAEQQLESLALDLSYTLEGQFELVALVRDAAAGDFTLLDGRQARGKRTLISTGAESPWVLQHISCRELLFGRSYPAACVLYSGRTVAYDIRKQLREIAVPVLMISGRYDPIVPLRFQQEIVEGVAGPVSWEVFDLSAHMVFVEQPLLAMQAVLDFLGVPRQQIPQGTGL